MSVELTGWLFWAASMVLAFIPGTAATILWGMTLAIAILCWTVWHD